MANNIPFEKQSFIDVNRELFEKLKTAEFECEILLRPIEIVTRVSEKLLSEGCPETKLFDVFAYIGNIFLKDQRFEISYQIILEAIKKGIDVKIKTVDGSVDKDLLENSLTFDFPDQYKFLTESLTKEPDSDLDNYCRFSLVVWGIYALARHWNIIMEEEYNIMFLLLCFILTLEAKSTFYKAFAFANSLYRNNTVAFSFLRFFCKYDSNLKISEMNISDKDFSEDETENSHFRLSDFLIEGKKMYDLLSRKFCKRDRITIFKMLNGVDFELLEEYCEKNDVSKFCQYIKTASNYRNINTMCSFFDRMRRLVNLCIYVNEDVLKRLYLLCKVFDNPAFGKSYGFLSDVRRMDFYIPTFYESSDCNTFIEQLNDFFDNWRNIYKIMKECLKPSLVNKFLEESNLTQYVIDQLTQEKCNDSQTAEDSQTQKIDTYNYSVECEGPLSLPEGMFNKELNEIGGKFFPGMNFGSLFDTPKSEFSPLCWNDKWEKLAYIFRIIYSGKVKQGKIVFSNDKMGQELWTKIQNCFHNSNKKNSKSMSKYKAAELQKKYGASMDDEFIKILQNIKSRNT